MSRFQKSSRAVQDLKWANIWFAKLAAFHQRRDLPDWRFTADDVIAFLKAKRDAGLPAWKRMKIIEALIVYRRDVQRSADDDLKPLRDKMMDIIAVERVKKEGWRTIEEVAGKIDPREPDVIQEFRRAVRRTGLALRTERAYVGKVRAFMRDRGLKCLDDFQSVTATDVEAHLSDLAVDGNVAPSTQNAAFHALLKLFQLVLKREMGEIDAIRASKEKPIPTVLSGPEVKQVLDGLHGVHRTIAKLLYGCGLRISEALSLRVKDIDFENHWIQIHRSKGGKSRLVPLPADLVNELRRWVRSREVLHQQDFEEGIASVWLPHALATKYPSAHQEFRW